MTRPAWLEAGRWKCSYCGQWLGILTFGNQAAGRPGWAEQDGVGVWRKPAHKDRPVTVIDHRTGQRVRIASTGGSGGFSGRLHTFNLPVVVICKNRDCQERVLLERSHP